MALKAGAVLTGLLLFGSVTADAAEQATIGARASFEKCMDMQAGETLDYEFEAGAKVSFNIHYHDGDKVINMEQQNAVTSFRGTLIVPDTQNYCLMWENRNWRETTLEYEYSTPKKSDQ